MNILQLQERLKDLPDNALMQEMQMPTGTAPQFLVLSELKRRKRMRDDFQRREAQDMKTVAEETVTTAGMPQQGIMQMSRAMAPNTNVAQNTGIGAATPVQPTQAPQPVQRMFDGGMTGLEQLEADPIRDSRAVRIGDRDFVMLPSGVVLDARTEAPASPEETLAVKRKLTPSLTADSAAFTEFQGTPSIYRPEAGVPSQADLDLKSVSDARNAAVGIGAADRMGISDVSADPLDFITTRTDPDIVTGVPTQLDAPAQPDVRSSLALPPEEQAMADYTQGLVEEYAPIGEGLERTSEAVTEAAKRLFAAKTGPRAVDFPGAEGRAIRRGDIPVEELMPPDLPALDEEGTMDSDTGTPLEVPAEGIAALMPPGTATQATDVASAARTSGAGGSGGAGFGSLDSRIASMLAAREKQAESDKWMALAQAGLALMSSDQPTLGGAIGEAGLAGIGALQKSRRGATDFEADMLKLQSELDLNRARIAAANRSGGSAGSGGLTANQLLSRGNDLIKSGQNMLLSAGDNADAVAEARSLITAGRNLIRQVTGGAAASGTGTIRLPSAG